MFQPIEAPTTKEIVCVTSVRNSFWVLAEDGQVFSRAGINESNPYGCFWEEINISPGMQFSFFLFFKSCCVLIKKVFLSFSRSGK